MKLFVLNELEREINYLRESEELLQIIFKALSYDLENVERFLMMNDLGIVDIERLVSKFENHFPMGIPYERL